MLPKKLTAALLFISAYSPLFIILAVKDFDFDYKLWFEHPIPIYILLCVTLISIIIFIYTIKNIKRGSMIIKVLSVKSRSMDMINYTIPYLFCAFDIDLNKIEDIITCAFFLFILLILTITSQSIFINPILSLMGYNYYDLDYEFDEKRETSIIITKLSLEKGEYYYSKSLTRFIYFITKKSNS